MPLNNCLAYLEDFLSGMKGKRILYVGIGNLLRRDDGVGVYISQNIRETQHIQTLTAEVSIENYIGKINSLHPDVLILTDCTEMGQIPGYFTLISPEKTEDHTFNTHNISLKRLNGFFNMPTMILAIQPETTLFGEHLTPMVQEAADQIISAINHPSDM